MKTKFTVLALFCATLLIAQNRVFQHPVQENNLSSTQKITKDLASGYIKTQYYRQASFDLKSDLQIPLPDGREITARLDRAYPYSNKSESYVYRIDNDPKAELVLSKYDNTVAGMYSSGSGEKVMFHQTSADIFALSSVSNSKLIGQDSKDDYILDIPPGTLSKVNSNVCLDTTPVCAATTIDVMVVFTTGAKTAWGGVSQSNAFIATAVTNFNTALTNSGVSNVTINLVYSGEIAYTESGNISTDLTRFRTNNDSYMDNIHTLRTTYGADICSLITSTPTNTCGLGYVNTNPTNYTGTSGFSVSLYNCAVSQFMSPADALKTMDTQLQNKEFAVYPNPAKENINIAAKDSRKYTFKVFNALGHPMITTTERSIDLKNWPSGEYFINIYDEKNTMTGSKKFIVH
ncbi:hypothetical protein IW15_21330 [Chryseobacterium soli]|uniref:Secretion system C-terminal sorting domain-containing protein n=1 Tax=Chryseobacterium soli TaxID=445961 RepID=A0A086A0U2_9FLAO|nr:T9SS type A sorting domain-containing protein [Chryseobacterium soli]KFF10306.1 hypothetical protein IW15_21330 [Chryseobacterium soli]